MSPATRRAARAHGFLLLALTLASPAAAQKWSWGVKAGGTAANLEILSADTTLSPEVRAGAVAGGFFDYHLFDGVSVQIEGLLNQKGTVIRDPRFDGRLDVRLNYLDVPVLGQYTFKLSKHLALHALAGPVFSFKVSDTYVQGGETLDDAEEQVLKSTDFGLSVGGAATFHRVIVDYRYVWGVPNINDDIDRTELTVRTRSWSISVGLRFK